MIDPPMDAIAEKYLPISSNRDITCAMSVFARTSPFPPNRLYKSPGGIKL
jgi:hypothetical protein